MLRRLIGLILIMVALGGIVVSIFGLRIIQTVTNDIGDNITESLSLVSDSLDTTEEMLLLSKDTLNEVNNSFDTIDQTTQDLSMVIEETGAHSFNRLGKLRRNKYLTV